MQLTAEELRTAVHADSHSYARLRARIAELRHQGKFREADARQADYNERLNRWIETIKKIAREGAKK